MVLTIMFRFWREQSSNLVDLEFVERQRIIYCPELGDRKFNMHTYRKALDCVLCTLVVG